MATATTIDDYIAGFPKDVQRLLRQMRATFGKAAPQATERISYGIPTFTLNGRSIHFAAFTHHIGFYPGSTIAPFKEDLSVYKHAKGSVQFPLDEPLPLALVTRIVKARLYPPPAPPKKRR
jgi:uncharacterized protein YdhG (YjbR/CyaY superfamily)